jgi:hypothetical protein
MEESSKRAVNRALAWCGPVFVIGVSITWAVMGHNLPPPIMLAMTPDQLISEYYGKYPSIAAGMTGAAVFGMFYTLWSCLLASLMRDEQGNAGPLTYIELSGGILTGWLFSFCSTMWAACAVLYPQVDPATIKLVHTLTWFIFACTWMITSMQLFAVAMYTILNKKQTMFPAWTGWLAAASGVGFLPLIFVPFVTDGPFTNGGLWNFWILLVAWAGGFFCVYNFYVFKHVTKSTADQALASGILAKVSR